MPYRSPGAPDKPRSKSLSGRPIRYYRPRGSADVRHLIDEGFQAFNAARLGEACRIFTDKMLLPEHDTTIALTIAGAHDAGRTRRLRGRADGARPGGLRRQHRRQPLPRPALRAELHPAPRLAVRERRGAVRRRRDPDLRRAVPGHGAARNRRLRARVPGALGAERAGVHGRAPLRAGAGSARAAARLPRVFGGRRGREGRRADLHLVARRQLDRHERRLSRADERQPADGGPQQGRERGVLVHPGRQEERLRDSRRRVAEELLPAGAADAVGGLRHPQGRQRLLHPDHDRFGGVGRAVGRDARRGRQLGQGEPGRAARHRRGLRAIRPSRSRSSASTSSAPPTTAAR